MDGRTTPSAAWRMKISHWKYCKTILSQRILKKKRQIYISLSFIHTSLQNTMAGAEYSPVKKTEVQCLPKLCLCRGFSFTLWLTAPVWQKWFVKQPLLNQPLKSVFCVNRSSDEWLEGITVLTQHPLSDIIFSARFYNTLCWSKCEIVEDRSKNLATSISEGLEHHN